MEASGCLCAGTQPRAQPPAQRSSAVPLHPSGHASRLGTHADPGTCEVLGQNALKCQGHTGDTGRPSEFRKVGS